MSTTHAFQRIFPRDFIKWLESVQKYCLVIHSACTSPVLSSSAAFGSVRQIRHIPQKPPFGKITTLKWIWEKLSKNSHLYTIMTQTGVYRDEWCLQGLLLRWWFPHGIMHWDFLIVGIFGGKQYELCRRGVHRRPQSFLFASYAISKYICVKSSRTPRRCTSLSSFSRLDRFSSHWIWSPAEYRVRGGGSGDGVGEWLSLLGWHLHPIAFCLYARGFWLVASRRNVHRSSS